MKRESNKPLLSAPPRRFTHSTNFSWSSWVHLILVLLETTDPFELEFPELVGMLPVGDSISCWEEKLSCAEGKLNEPQETYKRCNNNIRQSMEEQWAKLNMGLAKTYCLTLISLRRNWRASTNWGSIINE